MFSVAAFGCGMGKASLARCHVPSLTPYPSYCLVAVRPRVLSPDESFLHCRFANSHHLPDLTILNNKSVGGIYSTTRVSGSVQMGRKCSTLTTMKISI